MTQFRFKARSTTPGEYRLMVSNLVLLPILQADVAAAADVRDTVPRWTGATGEDVGTLKSIGGSISPQDIADALLLAGSGTPAAGSVIDRLAGLAAVAPLNRPNVDENGVTAVDKEDIAAEVESHLLDETDGKAVLAAVIAKIQECDNLLDSAELATIGAACKLAIGSPLQSDDERLPATVIAAKGDIPTDYQQRGVEVTLPTLPNVTVGGYAEGQVPAKTGDKMGLTDGAITDTAFTLPDASPTPTGFLGKMLLAARWMLNRKTMDHVAETMTLYADNGTTVLGVQDTDESPTSEEVGAMKSP